MSYQKRKRKAIAEISQEQKSEIKEPKKVRELDIQIKEFPWTRKQQIMIEAAQMSNTKIVFINAPPGVGKTLISVYVGLSKLKQKKAEKIIYLRVPKESCSVGVGFLPSDLESKISPYLEPCQDQVNQLIGPVASSKLADSNVLEAIPVGFLKGRTLSNCVVIADEVEDCSVPELRMIMSRIGKNCLMFLIGDENQSNIKNSGFRKVFDAFDNDESIENGIFCFELTAADSMRSGITKYIIERFDTIPKL